MVVLSLLIGLLIPALARSKEEARKTQCRSNLSQIGLALEMYANDNGGWTPEYGAGLILLDSDHGTWDHPWDHQWLDDWWFFGAMDNGWSVTGNNVTVAQPQRWLVSAGRPSRPILLGLLWSGGYLTNKGARILYCPSNDSGKASKEARYDQFIRYDADEPFWTSKGLITLGDNDGLGNPNTTHSYNSCYDGGGGTGAGAYLGEGYCWVLTNYSARYYNANTVRYSGHGREESQAIQKEEIGTAGLYSDTIELWGSVRVDGYGQGGDGNGAAPDDPGWKRYAVVNHDQSWNVLFADGSVKTYKDGANEAFDLLIRINNAYNSCIAHYFDYMTREKTSNHPYTEDVFIAYFDTAYRAD